ncbi:CNPV271 DNA packaging protein [Rhizophagus irregularis DAOM 181602=DAOM 197198]|nr:CNPV271 DNA packaging protein [Rhizophagus irregularis DAOM 181602=DAOM 197198]
MQYCMEFFVYNVDEISRKSLDRMKGNKYSPDWPFRLLVTGGSHSGKTNMVINLILVLVLVGKHAEPKWELVKNAFHIFANSPDPYRENISFQTIKAEKIPDISKFSPKGSTVIVFEDLCAESKKIQERIVPYFISGRHQNISPIYVTQKYQAVPKIIRESISHLVMFRGSRSREDICRVVRQYTDDPKKASKIIDKHLRNQNFIVFDFTKAIEDPLAIRLGWDTPLKLDE